MRRPSPNYMEGLQRDITKGMRGILIDWLVEVVISIILSGFLLIFIHDYSTAFLSRYQMILL